MKPLLWLTLAFCLGLTGCTAGSYYQPGRAGYEAAPESYQLGEPSPWFYDYDPAMRQWFTMPYINPYVQ